MRVAASPTSHEHDARQFPRHLPDLPVLCDARGRGSAAGCVQARRPRREHRDTARRRRHDTAAVPSSAAAVPSSAAAVCCGRERTVNPVFGADIIELAPNWIIALGVMVVWILGAGSMWLASRDAMRDLRESVFGAPKKGIRGIKESTTEMAVHVQSLRETVYGDSSKCQDGLKTIVEGVRLELTQTTSMTPTKASVSEAFEKIRAIEERAAAADSRMDISMERIEGLFRLLSAKIDRAMGVESAEIEPALTPPHGIPRQGTDPGKHNKGR